MKSKKTAPKHAAKVPISSRPRTKATPEAVNLAAVETMALGVDAIRDIIEGILSGSVVVQRRDAGSLVASLAAKAGAIYEATRKDMAARRKQLDRLTPAIVLAWLRGLDPTDRATFLREAEYFDKKGSGLG